MRPSSHAPMQNSQAAAARSDEYSKFTWSSHTFGSYAAHAQSSQPCNGGRADSLRVSPCNRAAFKHTTWDMGGHQSYNVAPTCTERTHLAEKAADSDEDMVYLCCRIHPLIRDSAFVRKVPFYVEWWRDFTLNGCEEWWVTSFLPTVALGFVAACLIECLDLVHGNLKLSERSLPELIMYTCFFLRVYAEPSAALYSFVYYKILIDRLGLFDEDRFQGSWSWSHSNLTKDSLSRYPGVQEIRTTSVALHPVPRGTRPPAAPQCRTVGEYVEEANGISRSEQGRKSLFEKFQLEECPFPGEERCSGCYTNQVGKVSYVPNRECWQGHWDSLDNTISCRMYSLVPHGEEWTEQMSLNELLQPSNCHPDVHKAYEMCLHSGDLRLAMYRLRGKDDKLDAWLSGWRNCWKDDSGDALRLKQMLDAWDRNTCTWGPPLASLGLPITAINDKEKGVLYLHRRLLSSILPRYGHKSSVEEVAYMSAKALRGDQRYYGPTSTIFWLSTAIFLRLIFLGTASFDPNVVILATATALPLWAQFAQGAFSMDPVAMVTGRLQRGCVLRSAWGKRSSRGAVTSGEVTATLLAKWNACVAKESHELLNSFHTENSGPSFVKPMDLQTFQKAGGLLVGELAIIPGRRDFAIRRLKLQDQVYEVGYSAFETKRMQAQDMVSHSPCPVGGYIGGVLMEEDVSKMKNVIAAS